MTNRDKGNAPSLPFRSFSLFIGCLLVTAAIAIAYILGVMSGRSSASMEHGRLAFEASSEQDPKTSNGVVQDGNVLPVEDLEYARVLRSDVAGRKAQISFKKTLVPMASAAQDTMPSSQASSGAVSNVIQSQEQQTSSVTVYNAESIKTPETPIMYDYIFQVAALPSEDAADALRQRLEGRGLRTRMERKSKKMYLVLVMLRGDERRSTEVMQILYEMRLGKPMTLSRKAVIQ